MPRSVSTSRLELAATALEVPAQEVALAGAVCAFRGYPTPGPGLASRLVGQALTALDQVPLDVHLYVHDLRTRPRSRDRRAPASRPGP